MTLVGWGSMTRRAIVVLGVMAAMTALVAAPARAATIVAQDGFEGSGSNWTFQRSGTGSGYVEVNSLYAREGLNNGALLVTTGWSAAGRTVYLMNGVSIRCNAWIYVQTAGAQLNIEVINPSTNGYIALKTVTVSSTGSGYRLVDVGPWLADVKQVRFRVALLAGGASSWARLDSMGAQCWLG
jgi:hypothetical protein